MPFQSFSNMDINIETMRGFASTSSSSDPFLCYKPPKVLYPTSCTHNSLFSSGSAASIGRGTGDDFRRSKKKKTKEKSPPSTSSEIALATGCNDLRKGKRRKELESLEEVDHVRARRGQATDSHSLAERVRREKMNKKMRRLQELVPGCNKEMGMAATLEEIINYVQSLQNQVEFLSQEIAAAFCTYTLSSETESVEKAKETQPHEVEKWVRDRNEEGQQLCFNPTWPF